MSAFMIFAVFDALITAFNTSINCTFIPLLYWSSVVVNNLVTGMKAILTAFYLLCISTPYYCYYYYHYYISFSQAASRSLNNFWHQILWHGNATRFCVSWSYTDTCLTADFISKQNIIGVLRWQKAVATSPMLFFVCLMVFVSKFVSFVKNNLHLFRCFCSAWYASIWCLQFYK